jgi:hypothetical protein
VFHRLPPPTDADIAGLLTRTYRRVRRLLSRRGRWADAEAGSDPFAAQEPLFASAADVVTTGRRSARLEGFSLHADVAVPARRRDQLERLCRYLLRPPLARERLTESTGGQLLYHFRRPWRDGSTALLLDPVELLARLAALVPPPRRPLLSYHGVLAPRAEWRSAVVPPSAPADTRTPADGPSPRRWPWAHLLHRVFAIEVLVCERCGGRRRILGAVTEPAAVRRMLVALGLAAEPPPGTASDAA